MKSWCTRRPRSAASESGAAPPPEVYTTTSVRSNTTTTGTCHCPLTFPSSSSPISCVCERLRGTDQGMCDTGEHVYVTTTTTPTTTRTARRVHPGPSGCAASVVRWSECGKRSNQGYPWNRIVWVVLVLVLAYPALAEVHNGTEGSSKEEGVCQSIDIRNNVEQFSRLEGCRIVEGFVQILLIDNAEPSEYANISFPELKEITGYLLLYRLKALRSIGKLFPNLTVIRGHSLFINYALVAFEMMSLQEIGLHSLTTIVRGSVRFEKNPALCYVDTIDWDRIAKAGKGEHVIAGNNPRNGCPVCDKSCPARDTKPEENLCWNQQHCQRICDSRCENNACDDAGNCCHPSCLGTCTGPTIRDCAVCKDVITDGECRERCPNGTFEFMHRRCIDGPRCRRMEKPREAFNVKNYPYKPFNGTCVIECPPGYMDEEVDGRASCKKCDGPCQKECPGTNVDSIATAQKLRGCTRITGSLEIQIRGGKNIVKELEDSLSTIEEIDGYLKVVRSFPLISLNFLKNLRLIRGNDIDNSKYTLVVLDNQNLQELWDWKWHPKIQILSKDGPGKVFFHFNPKLCLYKIETLREKADLDPFTDLEVAPTSNGDKVACNVTELKTRVGKKSAWGAVIEWEPFIHHDARSLLGYVVYFIEAPNRNVTMYDGRDACGGDGWRVDDVSASTNTSLMDMQKSVQTHYLSQLKPYTQYAYYVKTYTIVTERSGAQSNLTYFRTMPAAPGPPRSLTTGSNSSSELIISWLPPQLKNGNLTHYRIVGRWEPDDPNFIDQRNYCEEPMLLSDNNAISETEEEVKEHTTVPEAGTCECADRETDQSLREKEASSAIAFEDALHNKVYIRRKSSRKKRDLGDVRDYDQSITDKIENDTYITFVRLVPSTNLSFVMRNLRHFAAYNIEVQACRAPENDTYNNCSTKSMRTHRTLPLKSADNIPPNTFKLSISGENNSLTMVTLQWDEPPQPNGLIIAYQIEYKRVDIQNIQPTVVCITRRDFTNASNSYIVKDILPGNYSVRVRAMSLSRDGPYTQVQYFYIKEHNTFSTLWIVFLLLLCLVAIVICFLASLYKRKLLNSIPNATLIATVNPEYVSTPYVVDEWEVPREKVEILRCLGNGSFGMVYEGIARDIVKGHPEVRCAVKTVNKRATSRACTAFLNEASVMKGFNAHHVVKLLGVVSRGQPTLVIMELMVNGDLKEYLRGHRPEPPFENGSNVPPLFEPILRMAIQIADGMAYLTTKKYVHRDLAARNCMLAEDLTVKVGDFGMTRDVYERDYYRKESMGMLPIRWMAPESLKDGVFSSYSDVWSYGVVLWEIVTYAAQPYPGLTNDQVLQYVIGGEMMERPGNCPDILYQLMKRTWSHVATMRPTFMEIATELLDHVDNEPFKQVSFYHSPEGIEARNQNRSNSPQTDQHLELAALQDLQEEEPEGEEDSPLRQDFGDSGIKNSSSPRYRLDAYGENSKTISNCHDMNSSNVPLRAGFDDFDGVSGESITSGKDTLNIPFMENSLKSVRSSPFISMKSTSRGNLSHASNPDYENESPKILSGVEKRETVPLRVDYSSRDVRDIDNGIAKRTLSTAEYVNKPEILNNGYIGGTAT